MELILIGIAVVFGLVLLGIVMAVVAWVVRTLWALALILIRLLVALLKVAIPVAMAGGLFYLFGPWGLAPVAVVACFWLLSRYGGSLEARTSRLFREIEMATFNELHEKLNMKGAVDQPALRELLDQYEDRGKLEVLKFPNQATLYRWKERRRYRNGVITHRMQID